MNIGSYLLTSVVDPYWFQFGSDPPFYVNANTDPVPDPAPEICDCKNFTNERNVILFLKSKIAIYLSLGLQEERQKSLRIQIHNTAHNNAKKQGNQRTISESFENAVNDAV